MSSIIFVGIGGFLGASARYLLGNHINRFAPNNFPLGTLAVNVLGSFLLGLIVFHPVAIAKLSDTMSLALGIGFLGSFTTFSTLEYEILVLLENKKRSIAVIYVALSVLLGLGSAWLISI